MLSGEDEELAYPLDGDFIMMDCHRVISYNGRCLLSVNCRLHKVAHEGELFRPAYLLRNLFYLYDKVATFNLAKNEAIELTQPQLRSGLHKVPLDEMLAEYREQEVYHADRKRFAEFFDVKTIPERVAASKLGSIVEVPHEGPGRFFDLEDASADAYLQQPGRYLFLRRACIGCAGPRGLRCEMLEPVRPASRYRRGQCRPALAQLHHGLPAAGLLEGCQAVLLWRQPEVPGLL